MYIQINYVAVVAAAIAHMVVGFLWYGALFGKMWMSLSGLSEARLNELKARGMGPTYGAMAVASLIMAYVLAHFAGVWRPVGIGGAVQLAFWAWLGFIATTMLGSVLWEGKSPKLYLLNSGYYLFSLAVMSIIIVFWS